MPNSILSHFPCPGYNEIVTTFRWCLSAFAEIFHWAAYSRPSLRILGDKHTGFLPNRISQGRIYQKTAVQVVGISPQPFGSKVAFPKHGRAM